MFRSAIRKSLERELQDFALECAHASEGHALAVAAAESGRTAARLRSLADQVERAEGKDAVVRSVKSSRSWAQGIWVTVPQGRQRFEEFVTELCH